MTRTGPSGGGAPSAGVLIRDYRPGSDGGPTLAVFLDAIRDTAAADYTPEQLEAWAAPGTRDPASWNAAMLTRGSFVAEVDGVVVGFSDVSRDGRIAAPLTAQNDGSATWPTDLGAERHIDMLFVAPSHARQGIASALLAHGERIALDQKITHLTVDASITARPLFERLGFVVVAQQAPVRSGVTLTNFRMRKQLSAAPTR